VARKLKFCGPRKGPDFKKQALGLSNSIANRLWVASGLSNPQSLTHAAMARGPLWLCAFGPSSVAWLNTLP